MPGYIRRIVVVALITGIACICGCSNKPTESIIETVATPTTNIKYSLDVPGAVSLEIYNIKGQLVKALMQGHADKGVYSAVWDGVDQTGNPCSSGVYFYKLRTNSKTLVRKMLMLK